MSDKREMDMENVNDCAEFRVVTNSGESRTMTKTQVASVLGGLLGVKDKFGFAINLQPGAYYDLPCNSGLLFFRSGYTGQAILWLFPYNNNSVVQKIYEGNPIYVDTNQPSKVVIYKPSSSANIRIQNNLDSEVNITYALLG